MTSSERKKILKVALEAALVGGRVTLKYFRKLKSVRVKVDAGLVSEADNESESKIIKVVHKAFPSHKFLGEESGMSHDRNQSSFLWHIDPLDGTTNYVHGFPFFCVSIGLEVDGVLEVGVVYAPLLNQTYWAERGGGAKLNGKKIRVSETREIKETLLATGFSYRKEGILDNEISDFRKFSELARGIRRAGSAALDLCMVASGVFDGFWERELKSWDTAAGTLIVQEAGGIVTDFSGAPFEVSMSTILAGNKHIHPQLLATVKQSIF